MTNRFAAAALLVGLASLLGSCAGYSGFVADHWPHWAGGMPDDVPPRPGAPGYDEFIAHGQANQDATSSSAPVEPVFSQMPAAAGAPAAKPGARPLPAAPVAAVAPSKTRPVQIAPEPQAPREVQDSRGVQDPKDSNVVNGGLY